MPFTISCASVDSCMSGASETREFSSTDPTSSSGEAAADAKRWSEHRSAKIIALGAMPTRARVANSEFQFWAWAKTAVDSELWKSRLDHGNQTWQTPALATPALVSDTA